MECLIVIDMQNEFLLPSGNFPNNHVPNETLIENVVTTIDKFRNKHCQIIYVKSVYSCNNNYHNVDKFAVGTHCGKTPCCIQDSDGALMHSEILATIKEGDVLVTKNWFSAFKNTMLHEALQERQITKIYFTGVKTNVCVKMTLIDALKHGYTVAVIEDCVAATNINKHFEALNYIRSIGGEICYPELETDLRSFGEGDCTLFYNVLPNSISKSVYQKLKEEVKFKEMFHADKAVSRLVCVQGTITEDSKPIYRFPNDEYFDLEPWSPTMEIIKSIVEVQLKHPINHAKIQFYKDGLSYISPHSDKTLDIARGSCIINMSFGETRTFVLKKKSKECYEKQEIKLPHNSIFMFGLKTNMKWTHSVSKEPEITGGRISIVFRNIATFETKDKQIIGQGAKKDNNVIVDEKEEQLRLIKCFSKENKESEFDWEATYGQGFSAFDFSKIN